MAIIPTVIPAIRSRTKRDEVYFSFQQASMRARKAEHVRRLIFHNYLSSIAHHLSCEWQVKEALIIQIKLETKKPAAAGFCRARLMFEHCRDGFFVADTTNRFGQHPDSVKYARLAAL
jgi:hypothetical protein